MIFSDHDMKFLLRGKSTHQNDITKARNNAKMEDVMAGVNLISKTCLMLKVNLSRKPVTAWLDKYATRHGTYKQTKWSTK